MFLLSCSLLPGMPVTLMKQQKGEFGISEHCRQAQTFINKFFPSSGLLAVLAEPLAADSQHKQNHPDQ